MLENLITYALALGAVLRLSRLVVDDSITEPIRQRINRRVHRPDGGIRPVWSFLSSLIGCTWCTSMWVAAGVTAAAHLFGGSLWFLLPAAALTLSWLTGIIADWLDSPPPARHIVHHAPDPTQLQVFTYPQDVQGRTTTG